MLESKLDSKFPEVPRGINPIMTARYAVLGTVGNDSCDVVALFADGHESELESFLEDNDGLTYSELKQPVAVSYGEDD